MGDDRPHAAGLSIRKGCCGTLLTAPRRAGEQIGFKTKMTTVTATLGRAAAILLWISALPPQVAMAVEGEKHADIQALMQETGMLGNMNRTIDLLMPR